jgi:asparagine synthetase B (glutamine-hydrolysing)
MERESSEAAKAGQVVSAAFSECAVSPTVYADGQLVLAWVPGPNHAFHVCDATLCLLEGALYEHGSLRAAAGKVGPPEELLAAAYGRVGEEIFSSLRGDYWAVVWDRRARRGIVVCDHMGGRSPFWARTGSMVMFASELSDLLRVLPKQPDPDPVAMSHWLGFTAAPEGRSLWGTAAGRSPRAFAWLRQPGAASVLVATVSTAIAGFE